MIANGGRALVALAALIAVLVGWGGGAEATHSGYHYAVQWTAGSDARYYHPDCCLEDAYYGWAGINSRITTPDHFPQMNDPNWDHAVGAARLYFSNGSWIEHGWFAGSGGNILPDGTCVENCVRRTSNYGTFVERRDAATGDYHIHESQTPNFGEAIIYRIQRSSVDLSCWNVFIRYNQFVDQFCQLPISGAPAIGGEAYDRPPAGAPVEMPLSDYGWSNPNTNSALRIMGSQGYEPWDTTLLAGGTARYDERCTQPPYAISYYNMFYYFLAKSLSAPIC